MRPPLRFSRVYRTSARGPWLAIRIPVVLIPAMLAVAAPAQAWTPASQQVIAREAARLAPPDLARQIDRHRDDYRQGVLAPFAVGDAERHVENPDGSGDLSRVIQVEVEAAIEAIRSHQPFSDLVFRLGVVSHYLADANDPLAASDADPAEPRYAADYLRYMEHVEPRLPLLFYGLTPGLDSLPSLAPVIEESLRRGRAFYPTIGREYQRIGFRSGLSGFDDRSTAFGVAAVSFSQAVTDVVQALRYIWVRAGGIDERTGLPERGGKVLLLPRAEPEPESSSRRTR